MRLVKLKHDCYYARQILACALVCVSLICGIGISHRAVAQGVPAITQRHLNDYAAALEKCRRALLEVPGLRKDKEPLPAYILRISSHLPGEAQAQYLKRVAGYVDTLDSACTSVVGAAVVPPLKNGSAANTALWQRAARDIGYLPRRMTHVRAAFRTAQKAAGHASIQDTAVQHAIGSEILQTVQLILDAYANLRDARP